jgi:hypothetical protein
MYPRIAVFAAPSAIPSIRTPRKNARHGPATTRRGNCSRGVFDQIRGKAGFRTRNFASGGLLRAFPEGVRYIQ